MSVSSISNPVSITGSGETASTKVSDHSLDKERTAPALGRIASGVYIITAEHDGQRSGVLATWVAQSGFEPPMLSVALNKQRPLANVLSEGTLFTVNILSKDNMDAFKQFAAPAKEGVDRFAGLELKSDYQAGPVLSGALAYLDCQVAHVVTLNDHILLVATVLNGELLKDTSEPMVHVRKNGFQY